VSIPNHLKYSKEHEWLLQDGNKAKIGITHFAQSELGDIVFVELPKVGQKIKINEEFGTVESVKTVSSLYAPASGTILEVNQTLQNQPELVNSSPYEQGWMIVIELSSEDELNGLLSNEAYATHIGR
jgi:glycine cleavage system H protein